MKYDARRALYLLRMGTGLPNAQFREGQEEAIRHIVEGRGRLLIVQRTGWGKSIVYFIATQLLREGGRGPTLLVSPLLALMRNQIAAAERMGVRAATINSSNTKEWDEVEAGMRFNQIDILLISPERLANSRFRERVLGTVARNIALLVIDEAHCISDWGHDFRPHYRLIERTARTLPPNLRLVGTTATANNRVMDDLELILGPRLQVMRGDLNRSSLALQTIRLPSQVERLAWLAHWLPKLPGSGIVYTLTLRDAALVAEWIQSHGLKAKAYTSRSEEREQLEQELLENQLKVLVATTALGMGFDKPDLAFVIHYQTPGSVVAYYQQVGRAGRALNVARGVLLSGQEDTDITDFFIRGAFPSPDEVEQILKALESEAEGMTVRQIEANVNVSTGRIRKTTDLLALESPPPIVREGYKWQLTAAPLKKEFWKRTERLTELRYKEQTEMQEYVQLDSGHMEFLIRALDGDIRNIPPPPCEPLPSSYNPDLVTRAVAFLRRSSRPLEPRRQWPEGKRIPPEEQAQEGRVLCIWNDAGWGQLVRDGKYKLGYFSDELVHACAKMVRKWNPNPPPAWVTAIPSQRHPDLVPDFARRLAVALNLLFRQVLQKTGNRPEQKTMQNSAQQFHNIAGSLIADVQAIRHEPVLLVDDIVDSRWTLTVAAAKLYQNGCGLVWPMALANSGGQS